MSGDYLIENARNIVWVNTLGVGRNNPISLHTNESSIYRVTGYGQIKDIIYSGYVKPKEGKINGGNYGVVYWSRGGNNLFFFDKRPVVEASYSMVEQNDIGSISLDSLLAIWIFNAETNCYENRLDLIKEIRTFLADKDINLDKAYLASLIQKGSLEFKDKQDIIEKCRQGLNSDIDSLLDIKDSLDNKNDKISK